MNWSSVKKSYNYIQLPFIRKSSNYKNGNALYCKEFIALDTETSWNHDIENPVGWIYQWSFALGEQIIIGRKPSELVSQLEYIHEAYKLDTNRRMVVYVHNLSYDIQYLMMQLRKTFNSEPKILAIKSHKILTFYISGFEFRCTYLLSNMSLDAWSKQLNCRYKKMVGEIDYNIIRYQDSALTKSDWRYMIHDVLTLQECVRKALELENDTIITIPLTSTGYVRRDVRNACRKDKKYRKFFEKTALEYETYELGHNAFSGAYSHGNRFYAGMRITTRIGHYDFKSQYPSVQQLCYFPVSKPARYYTFDVNNPLGISIFEEKCNTHCVLCDIYLKDGTLKDGCTTPYLQKSKCRGDYILFDDRGIEKGHDNGRIINFKGWIKLTITELDYEIISKCYDFDKVIIGDCYIMKRGKIPDCILDVVNSYFEIKENWEDGYFKQKSKNKLNGIFGMSATDIVREINTLNFESGLWQRENNRSKESITEILQKYYKNRNSFNNYLFGVWTTAHARKWLLIDIIKNVVGWNNYIYADTDSCFFIYSADIVKRINVYNEKIIELNKSLGKGIKKDDGTISYYGTFEDESKKEGVITEFKFLHAKCYAFVSDKKGLQVTIAGVTKNSKDYKNNITSAQELGCLDNLKKGFTFKRCGGTRSIYTHCEPHSEEINKHNLEISSACIIVKTEKKMSSNVEYFELYEEIGE